MRISIASAIIALSLSSTAAFASGCPVGKEGPSPFTPVTTTEGDIQVHGYQVTDLSQEAIAADGWKLRSRSIAFPAGSVIALHSHEQRPEMAMMKHGTVTVYESNCTVSYQMKEGDVFQSGKGDAHWVGNESEEIAVMYVVDVFAKESFPGAK